MRQLEQRLRLTRAALRRSWARLSRVDPELGAPARLVLRLDDADLPGSLGEGTLLQPRDYDQILAQAVQWLGPIEVTVLATHSGDHASLIPMVRFAHRDATQVRRTNWHESPSRMFVQAGANDVVIVSNWVYI